MKNTKPPVHFLYLQSSHKRLDTPGLSLLFLWCVVTKCIVHVGKRAYGACFCWQLSAAAECVMYVCTQQRTCFIIVLFCFSPVFFFSPCFSSVHL